LCLARKKEDGAQIREILKELQSLEAQGSKKSNLSGFDGLGSRLSEVSGLPFSVCILLQVVILGQMAAQVSPFLSAYSYR